jgi:hypothetical protein
MFRTLSTVPGCMASSYMAIIMCFKIGDTAALSYTLITRVNVVFLISFLNSKAQFHLHTACVEHWYIFVVMCALPSLTLCTDVTYYGNLYAWHNGRRCHHKYIPLYNTYRT